MSALVKRLHEQRMNIEKQIRDIIDAADGRDFTAEENEQIDKLDGESRNLNEAIGRHLDAEQESRAITERLGALGDLSEDEQRNENTLDSQVRSFLRGETRSLEIRPERRDLSVADDPSIVPTSFYNQLQEHMIEVSGILAAGAFVLRTDSGEALEVPKTTSHGAAALVAEGGSLAESDPAFAKVTLNAYKYGMLVQVTRELVEDTGVDLLGYLARACGRSVGNAFGAHAVAGDGSSKPNGIVGASTAGVTGATGASGAFTADNLIDLFYSVIAPYRRSPACGWLMDDATVAAVRKLKDANEQYLWQPSMQIGAPDSLLGKPVYTDPNVPTPANSAKSVLFGDMSQYWVRMVNGLRFERSDDFAFSTDLVSFRCVARMDGDLIDTTGAVKHFVGGAAS